MEVPSWSSMDQKQRIMAIAGGVVLLVAIVLIVRSLLGGGGSAPTPPPAEVVEAMDQASKDGTFKAPPPEKEEVPELQPGEGRGLRPE